MNSEDSSFLGTGWAFPPTFVSGPVPTTMVTNDSDIQESLSILFSTIPGERVHRYDYGCNLRPFSFEPLDEGTKTQIKNEIEKAILLFESRVTLNGITLNDEDENVLKIGIDYTIRLTNQRSNMVYPFYLGEGTNVQI